MKPLLTTLFVFTILVTPSLVLGAENVTQDGIYTGGGLVPCGQTAANPCNSCHVVILANTIVKWVIGITFLIFAGMGVYTGVKMVISGGNAHAKEDAKEMFTNLIIGLLIILGAWLMIDTLLRFVLKGGENGEIDGYGPWSQVKCVEEVTASTTKMTIDEAEWVAEGGDSDVDSSGGSLSGGKNCPVPSASSVVDVPTQYTGGRAIKLKPEALENFKRMHAAAKAKGITITIRDGWRDDATQVILWNRYNGKSAVAKPCSLNGGGSNHNSGVAIDIVLNSCKKTTQNCKDPIFLWMMANGGSYGFRNTFPPTNLDNVHFSPSGR